jgi:hypothetical protein
LCLGAALVAARPAGAWPCGFGWGGIGWGGFGGGFGWGGFGGCGLWGNPLFGCSIGPAFWPPFFGPRVFVYNNYVPVVNPVPVYVQRQVIVVPREDYERRYGPKPEAPVQQEPKREYYPEPAPRPSPPVPQPPPDPKAEPKGTPGKGEVPPVPDIKGKMRWSPESRQTASGTTTLALAARGEPETLARALYDIRRAWLNDDYLRLQDRFLAEARIRVIPAGGEAATMTGTEFGRMTRDALRVLETVDFEFDPVPAAGPGRAVVTGRHTFITRDAGAAGRERVVYISYTLERRGDRWRIVEAGSAPERIRTPAAAG